MTDHELVVAAAKAAGMPLEGFDPLEFNTDAFRLMVALKIQLLPHTYYVIAYSDGLQYRASVGYGVDPEAATRRAIVECAAKIHARW